MQSRRWVAFLLFLLTTLTIHCSRNIVTREQWMSKNREERLIVVQSFIGGEQAADAKGGNGGRYSKPPQYYLDAIDAAYARGDQHTVNEIWAGLQDK